jgi:hypothetical protein
LKRQKEFSITASIDWTRAGRNTTNGAKESENERGPNGSSVVHLTFFNFSVKLVLSDLFN